MKTMHGTFTMPRYCVAPSRQRGMTLLVGLILLMMLTVVGTIGFRNTTMTERMTGNTVDRNVSFQSAESAGKEALSLVVVGTASAIPKGYFALPIAGGATNDFWTQGDGASGVLAAACPTTLPFSWQSCSAPVTDKYANNANKAQYVIELLKTEIVAPQTIRTYRITSRSTGGSGNADVVLQTQYVHETGP